MDCRTEQRVAIGMTSVLCVVVIVLGVLGIVQRSMYNAKLSDESKKSIADNNVFESVNFTFIVSIVVAVIAIGVGLGFASKGLTVTAAATGITECIKSCDQERKVAIGMTSVLLVVIVILGALGAIQRKMFSDRLGMKEREDISKNDSFKGVNLTFGVSVVVAMIAIVIAYYFASKKLTVATLNPASAASGAGGPVASTNPGFTPDNGGARNYNSGGNGGGGNGNGNSGGNGGGGNGNNGRGGYGGGGGNGNNGRGGNGGGGNGNNGRGGGGDNYSASA